MNEVSFPGFGIGPFPVDRVALTLPFGEGVDIMWYAVIITLGFVAAFLYAWYRAAHDEGYKVDDLLDMMIFVILFGVTGARLYYVVMSPGEFDSLLDVLNIRSGGLAIYGGLIAGVGAIIGVCKVKRMNLWRVLDMVAPGVMIAQAIGRWGNFMNVEAYGSVTSLPWRMCSPKIAGELLRQGLIGAEEFDGILAGTLGVHPTFLYESLWNVLGFVLLNLVYRKKRYNGQILLGYLVWYGFGRMWIEGLRTDSLYLGPFRVSQLVAFLSFAAALVLLILFGIREKTAPRTDLCAFCSEDLKSSRAVPPASAESEAGKNAPAGSSDSSDSSDSSNSNNSNDSNDSNGSADPTEPTPEDKGEESHV